MHVSLAVMEQAAEVFLKDIRLEWRTRFGIHTVMAFVASSLLIVLFSMRADLLSLSAQSGLLWIIVLFACLTSLSRTFMTERERETLDLLRLNVPAWAVFTGKLLFNFLFTLAIATITVVLFSIMVSLPVERPFLLILVLLLGSAGLSGATTLLAALVSQASRRSSVFAVLALPLLLPLVLLLVRVTQFVFADLPDSTLLNDLAAITGFAGATISASLLLIDNLWED